MIKKRKEKEVRFLLKVQFRLQNTNEQKSDFCSFVEEKTRPLIDGLATEEEREEEVLGASLAAAAVSSSASASSLPASSVGRRLRLHRRRSILTLLLHSLFLEATHAKGRRREAPFASSSKRMTEAPRIPWPSSSSPSRFRGA